MCNRWYNTAYRSNEMQVPIPIGWHPLKLKGKIPIMFHVLILRKWCAFSIFWPAAEEILKNIRAFFVDRFIVVALGGSVQEEGTARDRVRLYQGRMTQWERYDDDTTVSYDIIWIWCTTMIVYIDHFQWIIITVVRIKSPSSSVIHIPRFNEDPSSISTHLPFINESIRSIMQNKVKWSSLICSERRERDRIIT